MALSKDRIVPPGYTPHEHERLAFELLAQELPDTEPYHLWGFVDLIDPAGRRYDIDLLVIGYHAVYLIEVKSHPGTLEGDGVDWTFTLPGGARVRMENPLRATNHKARVLGSLLDRQLGRDPQGRDLRRPWVQPLVWLASDQLTVKLGEPGRMQVVTSASIRNAITRGELPGAPANLRDHIINSPLARATRRALRDLGLRPSAASLDIEGLRLGTLLEDGAYYQDHLGVHQSVDRLERRVRSYLVPASTTAERKAELHRAAQREAQHLTALSDHRNILRLVNYVPAGPLGGPCVIFEHFPDAAPLDAFLRDNPGLSFGDRISIIQQIAEALAFCHRKQIVHRALSPRAVLVRRNKAGAIQVRLYNFQLAAHEDSSATSHITALLHEQAAVYLAPEAIENPGRAGAVSDIFSLGCIAYHVLTGRPPGTNLAERAELLAGDHLSVAAVRDDLAGSEAEYGLDAVVAMATDVNPLSRADSAMDWLELLLDAATAPEPEQVYVQPLEARKDDLLDADTAVVKILGTGSTARVLRVRRGASEYALKVALSPELDERVRREGAVLRQLGSERIVSLVQELTLGERACLLLTDAGESLAQLLGREGPPSLDFARRWGEDLLHALRTLEDEGIQHRDIKPANLGVLPARAKKKRSLLLFDFSLASAPETAITAGTPAYRDPFLDRRGRWDAAADRWAAAMTLHELLTGTRPYWGADPGDGLPAIATSDEITLAAERFDASIRSRLVSFFRRALARDESARFGSADSMLTEWMACFATAAWGAAEDEDTTQEPADRRAALLRVSPDTPIEAAPLSPRARNALDRAGMMVVADLLRTPKNRLSIMRGIGRRTHQEILAFVDDYGDVHGNAELLPAAPFHADYRGPAAAVAYVPGLAAVVARALGDAGLRLLPEVAAAPRAQVARLCAAHAGAETILADFLRAMSQQAAPAGSAAAAPASPVSIEDWLDALVPARGKRPQHVVHARMLLGLDPVPGTETRVAEVSALAAALGKTRAAVHASLVKARARWAGHPHLGALCEAALAAVDALGGVAPLDRVAQALLRFVPHRMGTPAAGDHAGPGPGPAERAGALVRIAAETCERLVQGRIHGRLWLARSALPLELARELGRRADRLCERQPLPSSEEVRAALAAEVRDTELGALPPERLVTLAAEASNRAAPSARLELYPRGLATERALALSLGALPAGPVTVDAVQRMVQARYPEAEPVPGRPALDALLTAQGLSWNPEQGAYEREGVQPVTSADTQVANSRRPTTHSSHRLPGPASDEAREFEGRLRLALGKGHFRVLDVSAGFGDDVASEISRRMGVARVSLEREILAEVDRLIAELGIDPAVVVQADRQGPAAADDWDNLRELMRQASRAVLDRIHAGSGAVLLTEPGILARYGLDDVVESLVERSRGDDAPPVILINPTDDSAKHAEIDAATQRLPVPLLSAAQRLRVPRSWIDNEHRGGNH
jgi:serine/threonine protein kinase